MRIIAGDKKGRNIIAPRGDDTRPTLERVKEAVMGIVQFELPQSHVLDLFAGSGALGIEALSRGAKKCVFCDVSRAATTVIKQNLEHVGYTGNEAQVFETDYETALNRLKLAGEKFDVVFIDPPYAEGLYENVLIRLLTEGFLNEEFTLIVEHDKRIEIPEFKGTQAKVKKYGDVRITVIRSEYK